MRATRGSARLRWTTAVTTMALIGGVLTGCSASSGSHSSSTSVAAVPAPLTVDTSTARLTGTRTSRVRQFLGVRYAMPPTGARRFAMPVPLPRQTGTVAATRAGSSCAQAGSVPGADATTSASEDCLFLNVTTPERMPKNARLPVIVWWHGGGYTSGSGAAYDPQRVVEQGNVIVVTINYRLGVFGYFNLPGLAGGGDFGLGDQILATKWARTNAAAFGGDPQNITVFGESAGAMSACALLTSPQSEGLVDKVAMSSGGTCELNWPTNGLLAGAPAQTPYASSEESGAVGRAVAGDSFRCSGASALACMRRVPTADLVKVSGQFANMLTFGTALLPTYPGRAVADGTALRIPVLSGHNRDEERAFVGGYQSAAPTTYTAATYPTLVRGAYGSRAAAVLARYPLSKYPSAAIAFSTLITDSSWACPTLAGNAALAGHGSHVYGYEFADPTAPNVNGITAKGFAPGAAHAADVPYYFDLVGKNLLTTAAQQRLARTMIGYLTSFARDGRPHVTGGAEWPRVEGENGPTLQLGSEVRTADVGAEHQCSFWSTMPAPKQYG